MKKIHDDITKYSPAVLCGIMCYFLILFLFLIVLPLKRDHDKRKCNVNNAYDCILILEPAKTISEKKQFSMNKYFKLNFDQNIDLMLLCKNYHPSSDWDFLSARAKTKNMLFFQLYPIFCFYFFSTPEILLPLS